MIGTFIYISRLIIGFTVWLVNVMSKKLPVFKLHSVTMASSYCLKFLTISVFFLSINGFEIPQKIIRPSSQYKLMSFLPIIDLTWLRKKNLQAHKSLLHCSKSFLTSF